MTHRENDMNQKFAALIIGVALSAAPLSTMADDGAFGMTIGGGGSPSPGESSSEGNEPNSGSRGRSENETPTHEDDDTEKEADEELLRKEADLERGLKPNVKPRGKKERNSRKTRKIA